MNKIKNVAILGYGTIGRGVKTLLDKIPDQAKLVAIFDLPIKKEELGDLLISDIEAFLARDDLDVVFECLGGDEFAFHAISSLLKKGASVITSNKEVVSKHLSVFLSLAKENHCQFLFEASVGGGMPILKPLMEIAKFDEITSFKGILNGTCNYILTKVFNEGMDFKTALKQAQDNGFAEKDPHADLSGEDLKRKGIILANLCFHKQVDYGDVNNFGIERLSTNMVDYLKQKGLILKMMVKAKKVNDKVSLIVEPTIFEKKSLYTYVENEFNSLEVDAQNNGKLTFIGKGAGSLPTASAMLQDYMAILDGGIKIGLKEEKLPLCFEEGEYLLEGVKGIEKKKINTLSELRKYEFVARM